MTETLSTIFVAYHTPASLLNTSIDSVRAAADDAGLSLDLIIVDNGGNPDFADISDVRVVGSGKNIGFGAAVNSGLTVANGEWVLLMNPDSVLQRDALKELTLARGSYADNTLFGALLLKDGQPQVHAYNLWWSSTQLRLNIKRWRQRLAETVRNARPVSVSRLCGAGLFARREVLVKLGPFDDDFFLYGEDVDLSLRALQSGHELILVPTAVIEHDAGSSSEGASALVQRARTDAHLRLVSRYRGLGASVWARIECVAVAFAGLAVEKDTASRMSRLARLKEAGRWRWHKTVSRFDPAQR